MAPIRKFVEPSAAGPSSKIGSDGVVMPGKAHEAQEGEVTNPGVRTVQVGGHTGHLCPVCGESSLKMHMNKPVGQRAYCSSPGCPYDTARPGSAAGNQRDTRIVSPRVNPNQKDATGVKILRGTGI